MIVGLTGGIACGKSTVSKMFVERGAKLVDADRIAREVVTPGQPALRAIAEAFGKDILQADGTLHRKKLGAIVFGNPEERRRLEAITHPAIRNEINRQVLDWQRREPSALIIVDLPLLFEAPLDRPFTFEDIIVVYVPEAIQLQRLMDRDGLTEEEARQRLTSQMPIEEKRLLAGTVIDNSGSLTETEAQVDSYIAEKVK